MFVADEAEVIDAVAGQGNARDKYRCSNGRRRT